MRLKNFLKYFVFLHFVFLFPTITSAQNISLQKDAADTANTGTVDLGSGVTITGTPAIAGNPLNIENIRNSILTNSVTNLGGVTLTPPGSITSIVESANQQQLSHFIFCFGYRAYARGQALFCSNCSLYGFCRKGR